MRNRFSKNNAGNASLVKAARRTAKYHIADALGMRIKPVKLRVKVTNRCNAKCFMCNVWQMQDNFVPELPHEIKVDGYKKLVEKNANFLSRVQRISFTGGEPTLRRDLVEIIRTFTEAIPKAGISINSNGFSTRKTLDVIGRILEFRNKLTVMISLDGIGEAHDATRGVRNVFPKVQATIDGLLEMKREGARINVEVNHCMTERNADQLPKVFEFCKERNIYFNPIYIIHGALYDNENAELDYTSDLRQKLLSQLRELMKNDDSLQLREVVDMLEGRERDFDCWAGKIMFLLEEDGSLFPNGGCPKDYLLGNVKEYDYDLRALLDSEQAKKALDTASKCRMCRLSCETMTTLRYPEALTGYRRAIDGSPWSD